MIHILGKIPNKVTVALSGGPDSVALLNFLIMGRKDVDAAYFYHGTPHGLEAREFVEKLCNMWKVPLKIGKIQNKKNPNQSTEEYWREERYRFFSEIDGTIVTGHHLDDAVEWWIFSSLHGRGKLIPHRRQNVIRPLLMTPKSTLIDWCKRKELPYIVDPGNTDEKYARSIIRNNIVPEVLKVNPGIRKVVKKMIECDFKNQNTVWRPVC